jgi:hypothetical protein
MAEQWHRSKVLWMMGSSSARRIGNSCEPCSVSQKKQMLPGVSYKHEK